MISQKKILLIDDEEDFCFFVKSNLETRKEFRVITAVKGQKGIELARSEKPDLILLDIVMPKMAGSDVAEVLSNDTGTKRIPIVFLTGVVTREEMGFEEPTKRIGGWNFIAKTVGPEKIISCIEEILEKRWP